MPWKALYMIPNFKGTSLGEMAIHSSTLVWKIPWMEEYGRLQFTESQIVRHDSVTSLSFPFPGGSDSKVSAYNVGDSGLIPELGRSPGKRNGNPLQYSCLENFMDRGAWSIVLKESDMTEWLTLYKLVLRKGLKWLKVRLYLSCLAWHLENCISIENWFRMKFS